MIATSDSVATLTTMAGVGGPYRLQRGALTVVLVILLLGDSDSPSSGSIIADVGHRDALARDIENIDSTIWANGVRVHILLWSDRNMTYKHIDGNGCREGDMRML